MVDVDLANISDSRFMFDMGLTRTSSEDITPGLILIGPAKTLDSSPFDESSFEELNDFVFFKIVDSSGIAMNCIFLGVEGSSHLVNLTGIAVGEIITVAIPTFSLCLWKADGRSVCGYSERKSTIQV